MYIDTSTLTSSKSVSYRPQIDCQADPQIPDLPPAGEIWPLGTDESERPLPGQEFIPVEGIFNACSDGVTCIIDPLRLM